MLSKPHSESLRGSVRKQSEEVRPDPTRGSNPTRPYPDPVRLAQPSVKFYNRLQHHPIAHFQCKLLKVPLPIATSIPKQGRRRGVPGALGPPSFAQKPFQALPDLQEFNISPEGPTPANPRPALPIPGPDNPSTHNLMAT